MPVLLDGYGYQPYIERTLVKQTINWPLVLTVLALGVIIGIAYSNSKRTEARLATHDSRLAVLEADHAERKLIQAEARGAWRVVSTCLRWITFGRYKGE